MEGLALLTDGFIATFGVQGDPATPGGSSQLIEGKIIGQTSASAKVSVSNIISGKVDNTDDMSGVKKETSIIRGRVINDEDIKGEIDD